MLRKFVRDSAVYAVPAFVSRGLSLFLLPLYTRVLSPADYGSLDLLIVFAGIVNLTVALEVSQGVARFYTDETDRDRKVVYASSAFWFTVACYTTFGLLAFVYVSNLSSWVMGTEGMEPVFLIGVLYIWLNGIFYLVQNQFRWELRSKRYAAVSLIMTLVTAGFAVWLAYGLEWGLEGLLWGMVAGVTAASAYGLWHLRNSFRLRFDWEQLREMLVFSGPLVPSGIAVWGGTYVDRLMIKHFLSVEEVGLYGIGFRLASIAALLMVGFQGALTPLVYAHYRDPDTPRQLARIFRVFVSFALLLFMAITLFAGDLLALITTEAFYGGAAVVIYLVPAVLFAQMYIFAPGIAVAKKTHLVLWINLGGAILNACFNWWLIPVLGIVGAGLATMLGYFCMFGAYMWFSQRLYPVPHDWRRLAAAVCIAGLLVALLPTGRGVDVARWALNGFAVAAMAAMIMVLGLVVPGEIRRAFRELWDRMRSAPAEALR
jgi:O-antigen/teichoic acid export membrane protein